MFLHLCVILFTGRGGFLTCITGHMTGGKGSVSSGVCIQGESANSRACIQKGSASRGVRQTSPRYMGYYWIRSTSRRYASYWNSFLLPAVRGRQCFRRCLSVHNQRHGFSFTARPCYGAIGTHPTGMLSCFFNVCNLFV